MSEDLPPGLTADAGWFHVLRSMFESGAVRDMGLPAFCVLLAIKSHAGLRDGTAYPGQERLGELLGMSLATVKRALTVLVQRGHVQAAKEGRRNVYKLVETIPLRDSTGAHVATVSAPYVPMQFAVMLEAVKRAAAAGGPLTLNLTFVTGEHPTVHIHGALSDVLQK